MRTSSLIGEAPHGLSNLTIRLGEWGVQVCGPLYAKYGPGAEMLEKMDGMFALVVRAPPDRSVPRPLRSSCVSLARVAR